MGKKSKRRTAKEKEKTPSSGAAAALAPFSSTAVPTSCSSIIVSTLSQSSFANPFENEPTPKTGWARELRLAEKQLKDDRYRSPEVVLRAATAARAMRQFDKLGEIIVEAESKGVAINDANDVALVRKWRDECAAYKKRPTTLNEPEVQEVLKLLADWKFTTLDFDMTYCGLTALEYAAHQGDVPLLEQLVRLGTALDNSYDDPDIGGRRDHMRIKKPPGCTALLMAVVGALWGRKLLTLGEQKEIRERYEGAIECAVALVRMGANVDVRLHLPVGRDAKSQPYEKMKLYKWIGKSIRELALETGSELLVETIELFSSTENKIKLAHCRCGSRLPWQVCHSGTAYSGCHYKLEGDSSEKGTKILWRISPCAPCPCQNSKKSYFKCCWDEPIREYFFDDENAEMTMTCSVDKTYNGDTMASICKMINLGARVQNMNLNKFRKQCDDIRAGGQLAMEKMSRDYHPKSKLGTWDPDVYVGVTEHLNENNFFQWIDVHWTIPKPELLKRVANWNEALESYCDDIGLIGLEREKVIKLHTASELAPCANLNCDKTETKVKEFSRCSKCLSIAYCSSACLKEDYPFHRRFCTVRRTNHMENQRVSANLRDGSFYIP